jgi:hypothetical protein
MMKKYIAIFLIFMSILASCNFFEPQSFDTNEEEEEDSEDSDTQIPEKVELFAGASVNVRNDETRATVSFTGTVDVTPATEDFTVTEGAKLYTVSLNTSAVFVTVTFEANTTGTAKTYTVGIAANSTVIKGSASVAITQAPDAMDLLPE